jgi:outer membrane protein OmpA-like peptidoglycan-associated protein
VPVDGAVNDPNVNIQQIINKALGSAMAKTSMLVLKSLLQPYGALITIAQYAGEEATKVRLAPIEFDDGVATLNAASIAYATKVADLISERESLIVKLCGVTDSDDLAAIRAPDDLTISELGDVTSEETMRNALIELYHSELQALASERAKSLRTFLLQEQNVNPEQLMMCLSKHSKESIVGGVELSI